MYEVRGQSQRKCQNRVKQPKSRGSHTNSHSNQTHLLHKQCQKSTFESPSLDGTGEKCSHFNSECTIFQTVTHVSPQCRVKNKICGLRTDALDQVCKNPTTPTKHNKSEKLQCCSLTTLSSVHQHLALNRC